MGRWRRSCSKKARILARVRHPNVVGVFGAAVHHGRAGFWMEFVAGDTLEDRLLKDGPFGADEAAAVGRQVCRALAAVHNAGLIHRDVKARNIMRERGGRIVLMDFGAGIPIEHLPRAPEHGRNADVTSPPRRSRALPRPCRAMSTRSACCCTTW